MLRNRRLVLKVPLAGWVKIGLPLESVVANQYFGSLAPLSAQSDARRRESPFMTQNWPPPLTCCRPGRRPRSRCSTATLQGVPVWNCVMPLICQPPSSLAREVVLVAEEGQFVDVVGDEDVAHIEIATAPTGCAHRRCSGMMSRCAEPSSMLFESV